MSEHAVTDALTLLARLAEPGVAVAIARRHAQVPRPYWYVISPEPGWPQDVRYTLSVYDVEVYPSKEAALEAHPDAFEP